MSERKIEFVVGLIIFAIVLGLIALSAIITKSIMNSDLPLWFKIFLLK